jgi:MOSC domain-containing protein YiiM
MVNPTTAIRDLNVPKQLMSSYDHMDMGIYTTVVQGGEIKVGDEIDLI